MNKTHSRKGCANSAERFQRIYKILLICLIAAVVVSTMTVGSGQATNTASSTEKYVVFRCDDVAPRVEFAELRALNQVHVDKNVPVTLGIVPHLTAGAGNDLLADSQFASYMTSLASNPLFEFAQHGYVHQKLGMSPVGPSEFYGRPYAVQYNTIRQGRDDINAAFGVTPTSFIPPYDKGDTNTLKAAQALGFTEYCTGFGDFNTYAGTRDGIRIQAVSLMLTSESLQSAESKTNQFFSDPRSADTFVILYHPYEFSSPNGSVNKEKIALLEHYIDYLKARGDVRFTTLDRSETTRSAVSLTTGDATATSPVNDTGSTQQTPTASPSVQPVNTTSTHPVNDTGSKQQTATLNPSVQVGSTLIGGVRGSWAFLLIGTISALVLGACLVLFRDHKRRV